MMDRGRKRELKEQYKQMKLPMGIFIIRSRSHNKCFIQTTQDLKGSMNGTLARLHAGIHPNRELQKEWKAYGPDDFTIDVLEELEYDEDKTDYSDDLALLQLIWEERLTGENLDFYRRRL